MWTRTKIRLLCPGRQGAVWTEHGSGAARRFDQNEARVLLGYEEIEGGDVLIERNMYAQCSGRRGIDGS